MNNLVYFGGYVDWSMIVIVSWTVENNLFFKVILVGLLLL